ncbi:MAG: hypothetical protein M0026_12550 [Nocardiopsaceae bacterium]|nr:hypothetical protein [Nocardiopsaceae bacterium]
MSRHRILSSILSMSAAACLVTALVTVAVPSASADEIPDWHELMNKCGNGTARCEFHATGPPKPTFASTEKKSPDIPHCAGDENFKSYRTEERHTVRTVRTVGGSVMAGVSSEIPGIAEFETVVEAEFGHGWHESHTYADSATVNPEEGHIGWLELRAPVYEYEGIYELHFEDKQYGHYIWYIPSTTTVPRPASTKDSQGWKIRDRKMTDAEKKAHCADKDIGE